MNTGSASPDGRLVMSRRQQIRETYALIATLVVTWVGWGVLTLARPSDPVPASLAILATMVVSLFGFDRLLVGSWSWPLGPHRPRHRRPDNFGR